MPRPQVTLVTVRDAPGIAAYNYIDRSNPMTSDPRSTDSKTTPEQFPQKDAAPSQAAQHVANARELLKSVGEKHGLLEKHPELAEAITKLELALAELTLKTGGLL